MAKSKQKVFNSFGFKILVLITLATLTVYAVKNYSAGLSYKVLGASTLLADKGSDSGSSDSSGSGSSGSEDSVQSTQPENAPEPTEPPHQELNVSSLNNVLFETETKSRIRLGRSSIEISSDDGRLQIKAKHEDGTETQLNNDSLDKINDELENEGFEISTNSGGFGLRHGQFEAQTRFPLSINPQTNELTVTTPAGTKVVAILPDQAVANLINQKFINIVASDSADTGITLDTFNNQTAFQIHGKSLKKLLGLFPIEIDKTGLVSAENGSIISVNESFLSKLLDLFSN